MKITDVNAKETFKVEITEDKKYFKVALKLVFGNYWGALFFFIIVQVSLKTNLGSMFESNSIFIYPIVLATFGLFFFPGVYGRRILDIFINKFEFLQYWIFILILNASLIEANPMVLTSFWPYALFFAFQMFLSKKIFKNAESVSEFAGGLALRNQFKSNFITSEQYRNGKIKFLRFFFCVLGYIKFGGFVRPRISIGMIGTTNPLFDDIFYDYSQKPSDGHLVEEDGVLDVNQVGKDVAVQRWVPEYIATSFIFTIEDADPKKTSAFACYSIPLEKIAYESFMWKMFDDVIFYSFCLIFFRR